MRHSLLSSVVLTLCLVGCVNEGAGLYEGIRLEQPTITVNSDSAEAGDPISVTVAGTVFSRSENPNREELIRKLMLGVCFAAPDDDNSDRVGFCSRDDRGLTPEIQLLENSTYLTEIKDVSVSRGDEKTFEHKFSFTIQEENEVILTPYMVAVTVQGDLGKISGGSGVGISFQ